MILSPRNYGFDNGLTPSFTVYLRKVAGFVGKVSGSDKPLGPIAETLCTNRAGFRKFPGKHRAKPLSKPQVEETKI